MSAVCTEFTIPPSQSLAKVSAALKQKFTLVDQSSERLDIQCLDSFDWRVYRKKASIEVTTHGNVSLLRWRKLHSSQYPYYVETTGEIGFAWNLPASPLRELLSRVLSVRALIPQLELRVRRRYLNKLNKDKKTVLRFVLHEYELFHPETASYKKLQKRLEIVAVKGYVKPYKQALDYIERELRLPKSDKDILTIALNALGRQPTDYLSKGKCVLQANMPATAAIASLLKQMLKVMAANEQGMLEDIDSEFLHDYRIALRKTRSALKQIKGVFPQRELEDLQLQLNWLSSVTSPARDIDVYLLKFPGYRQMLPAELQQHLEPLQALLLRKKRTAYKNLATVLKSKRYADFQNQYWEFLHAPVAQRAELVNAGRAIKSVADERIWKVYKRVLKEGSAIQDDSPAEDLHELRKTCKKLRYLMEFFQSLYGIKAIKPLVKELKGLQDNLGEFNDLHIQAETLKEFTMELDKQSALSPETRQAMSLLIQHIEELQAEERNSFVVQFEKSGNVAVKRKFKQLFKPVKLRTNAD
jgi:CHAD domain-containing protein